MTFFSLIPVLLLVILSVTPLPSTLAVKLSAGSFKFNATVAKDMSGDYTSIADAIAAAPSYLTNNNRYYIRIKPGIYDEHVVVWPNKTYLALVGDYATATKITGNLSNSSGYSIMDSGSLIVHGNGFMAWNLTIENSAGPRGGQAVALDNAANHTAFYKCVILGYQDTLLANTGLQFYKECDIYGTVDFIFGSAKAVFQDCRIFGRQAEKEVYLTAQAKKSMTEDSGFSFQNCTVTLAPPESENNKTQVKVYLGRPWKNYATVVFMESFLDEMVAREGWKDWENRTEFVYLVEYGNRGPGAKTSRRVKWPGVHVFTKPNQAKPFTVENYIHGCAWIPETGVPFSPGLNPLVATL